MAYSTLLRRGEILLKEDEKWCPSCGVAKARDEFAPDKVNADGLAGHCRKCKSEKAKAYYEQHRIERIEAVRKYALANPEKVKQVYRAKVAKNPQKYRLLGRKRMQTRRAKLRNAFVESIDPQVVIARDKGICGICGRPVKKNKFEIDHIVPLAAGGKHEYSNVQIAHVSCNRSKGAFWQFDI